MLLNLTARQLAVGILGQLSHGSTGRSRIVG